MSHLDWRLFPVVDPFDSSTDYFGIYDPGLLVMPVSSRS